LHRLAGEYEKRRQLGEALRVARRQVALDPYWEAGHRTVMRLLALKGQRNAALAQYEALQALLAEELGVEPEPETTRL
jgi:DNA-binding SARP family transcriptional activator